MGWNAHGYLVEESGRERVVRDDITRVERAQNLGLQVKGQRAQKLSKDDFVPQLHTVSPPGVIHPIDMVHPAEDTGVGKANAKQPLFLLGNRDLSVIVAGVLPHMGKAESMRGGPTG